MGADGALQLALLYPEVFPVAGAHSPVLREYESAPAYFGDREHWADHAPGPLIQKQHGVAAAPSIWLDAGDADQWRANVDAFHALLLQLEIAHEWRVWPGHHENSYWRTHLADYLRFYGAALSPSRGAND